MIGYRAFKKHPIGCFCGDWVVKDFGNWLGVIETIEIMVDEGCHACNAWMLHLMGTLISRKEFPYVMCDKRGQQNGNMIQITLNLKRLSN